MSDLTSRSIEDVLASVSDGQDILDLRRIRSVDPYALLLLDLLLSGAAGSSISVRWPESDSVRGWMQKMGLEWFYRFAQEPGRMWKRYLFGNMKFISIILKAKFN